MDHFIPYHYDDLTVPLSADGTPTKNYLQYIEWLAEYLNKNNFTINPDQNEWIYGLSKHPLGHIALILSDEMGINEMEREIIVSCIRDNVSYAEIFTDEKEQWKNCLTGDPDIDEPFEEACISKKEFERIKKK